MDKKDLIREVAEEVKDCTKCPLHKSRGNVVPGEGNPNSRIMFIGEGPGADEDQQGRPFVGRSGKLLTKIIESVGFKREDIFITNVVKCRPPENRNPSEEEMESCNCYLMSQIAIIKPKIIVTVGSVPTKWLLKEKVAKIGISKLRGNFFEFKGIKLFPIFHPSYLLRNSSLEEGKPKWITWQDMKTIKEEYEKETV